VSHIRVKISLLEVAKLGPAGGVPAEKSYNVGPDKPVLLLIGTPPTRSHVPRQIVTTQDIHDRLGASLDKLGSNLEKEMNIAGFDHSSYSFELMCLIKGCSLV
jgi:hypothetical protein